MAYTFHITRRTNWFEKGNDIDIEEWNKLVNNDKELKEAQKIKGETQEGTGFEYSLKNSSLAEWTDPKSKRKSWFYYQEGVIDFSNPDEAVLQKAKEIAGSLDAKVQGDELEDY